MCVCVFGSFMVNGYVGNQQRVQLYNEITFHLFSWLTLTPVNSWNKARTDAETMFQRLSVSRFVPVQTLFLQADQRIRHAHIFYGIMMLLYFAPDIRFVEEEEEEEVHTQGHDHSKNVKGVICMYDVSIIDAGFGMNADEAEDVSSWTLKKIKA